MNTHYAVVGVPEGCVWRLNDLASASASWTENILFQPVSARIPTWIKIFSVLFGTAAVDMLEIGVFRGGWMKRIVDSQINLNSFTGVDPYSGGAEDPYTGAYWKSEADAQALYEKVKQMYDAHGQNLVRMTAKAYASQHKPGPAYNAIFIDGDHRYEHCLADAESFWTHLKPGGILMFDDYANTDHPGVTKAVNEFAMRRRQDIEYALYFGCHFVNTNKIAPVINGQICLRKK